MPGSHKTSRPSIRARRARMSWIVLLSTWPSVSIPVMFGGGMTIEKAAFDEFGSALKSQLSIQRAYHFGSTLTGSYVFESSGIAQQSSKRRRRLQNEKVARPVTPQRTCDQHR